MYKRQVTYTIRLFRIYLDASEDGFGASLQQEQDNHTTRPILFIGDATIQSERHWTPVDLEARSIAWSITRLQGYLVAPVSVQLLNHKVRRSFH